MQFLQPRAIILCHVLLEIRTLAPIHKELVPLSRVSIRQVGTRMDSKHRNLLVLKCVVTIFSSIMLRLWEF